MTTTTRIHPICTGLVGIALAAACALMLLPAAGLAAGKRTETLRFFSKPVSFTYTTASGTVLHHPPTGQPQAGDLMEIDSLDFVGNHRRHARRWTGSDHLSCVFGASGEPDCHGVAAVRGSLLLFHGTDFVGGTGRYQGATGKTLKNREVKGGSDIVVRLRLR
jgi:hypothetical protein